MSRRVVMMMAIGITLLATGLEVGSRAARADTAASGEVQLDAQEVWGTYHGQTRSLLDEQTELKRWRVAELPNVAAERVVAIAPAIRENYKLTGEHKAPVQTVRTSPDVAPFELDLGELAISMHALRVIGMVRSEDIDQYRKPLYVELTVNGPQGVEPVRYRQRVPYWDDFYSVTELYFNVDHPGRYTATVSVGERSIVDLYVNRLELHDVLAGLAHQAAKQAATTFAPHEREQLREHGDREKLLAAVRQWTGPLDAYIVDPSTPELTPEQRAERDAALWHAMPPLNSQYTGWSPAGFPSKDVIAPPSLDHEAIRAEYGHWEAEASQQPWLHPLVVVNRKLDLRYGPEDFAAYRVLPEPWPFPDDGGGAYIPPAAGAEHAEQFAILPWQLSLRWRRMVGLLGAWDGHDITHRLPYLYHAMENERAARDAALLLCKWAHIYPAFTQAQVIDFTLIAPASMYNRDLRLHRRFVNDGLAGVQQGLVMSYDLLYDYIRGNDELAQAVNQFIPWVKTEADVRRLIETRVLQFGARQSMYYNLFSDKDSPRLLFRTALVQQDPAVTEPWMAFLWRETWIYPYPLAGLPDYLSTTTQRDGTTDIGSVFYTGEGSPLAELALWSQRYVAHGGDPRYDLTDMRLYGKLQAAGRFLIDRTVAGGYPMSIGDVGGKPRIVSSSFASLESDFREGYALSGGPELAWMIVNYFGRGGADDATWAKLQREAQSVGGNPLLQARPRVMANWAGILEHGHDAADFRFLTSAYMRVGTGYGHSHNDTLDLQLVAHGLPMLNDIGWRGSYSSPKPGMSQLHNLVEVDEKDWLGHAWIDAFAPGAGVSYMHASTVAPNSHRDVTQRTRGVALIDVSPGTAGEGGEPMPYTNETRFDASATTPQTYVFDVQRVAGGRVHTWAMHGTISDEFAVNMTGRSPTLVEPEVDYLRRFLQGESMKYAGDAPETIVATWRLRRTDETIEAAGRSGEPMVMPQSNFESSMLGTNYDPQSPAKYTRVHLPVHQASRLLVGHIQPNTPTVSTTWPFLFAQRRAAAEQAAMDSVFASVIEPYVGEPFIQEVRAIKTNDNATDAGRAVALEVMLADGRRDVLFSNDRIEPQLAGNLRIAGRFAFVRQDDAGLVSAKLVEGTMLATPWGRLTLPQPSWNATITRIDYPARRVWLDADWRGAQLVGEQVEFGNAEHRTSYTIVEAQREAGKLVLTLDKTLDLSYAHVKAVDPEAGTVEVNLIPTDMRSPGMNAGLTCTNADMTRQWHCELVNPGSAVYRLHGQVTEQDLPIGSVLRVWEMGVGDEAKLIAHASVQRQADGSYEMTSNAQSQWHANRAGNASQ